MEQNAHTPTGNSATFSSGSTQQKQHTYTPLPTATSIRLIDFTKIDNSNEYIQCSLVTVDLEDNPEYLALSYTWGCPFNNLNFELSEDNEEMDAMNASYGCEKRSKIECDGAEMMIMRNLYEALTTLPQALMTMNLIWIDSICIDQNNHPERNAQVALMGDIFSKAQTTIIWLGRDLPRTNIALGIIKYLASVPEDLYEGLSDAQPAVSVSYQRMGLRLIEPLEWRTLYSFVLRSWFSRAWIVQEFLLAKEVRIYCGSLSIDWNIIYQCCKLLTSTLWDSQLGIEITGQESGADNNQLPPGRTVNMLGLFKTVLYANQESGLHPSQFLTSTKLFRATDPRDKIYGVFNILRICYRQNGLDESSIPAPDYTHDVSTVYTVWAFNLMLADRSLRMLSTVGDRAMRSLPEYCPSWVPDYSHGSLPIPLVSKNYLTQWNPFGEAVATLDQEIRLYENGWLNVSGIKIDTVVAISQPLVRPDEEALSDCIKLLLQLPRPYETGEPLFDALWRTLTCNIFQGVYPAPDSTRADFINFIYLSAIGYVRRLQELVSDTAHVNRDERAVSLVDKTDDIDPSEVLASLRYALDNIRTYDAGDTSDIPPPAAFDEEVNLLLQPGAYNNALDKLTSANAFESGYLFFSTWRRLLTTEKNRLGGANRDCRPGDQIWVLPGAQVPLLMRPVEVEGDSAGANFLQLVGEAYLHGCMHGEVYENGSELRKIVIV
jgi:hypothetical protein